MQKLFLNKPNLQKLFPKQIQVLETYPINSTVIKKLKKKFKLRLLGIGLKRFETVSDYYLASSGKRFETASDYLLISHSQKLFETICSFCQGELANSRKRFRTVSDYYLASSGKRFETVSVIPLLCLKSSNKYTNKDNKT